MDNGFTLNLTDSSKPTQNVPKVSSASVKISVALNVC